MFNEGDSRGASFDDFLARCRARDGESYVERPIWNTCASADAIAHFARGTGDTNPLWSDVDHGRDHLGERLPAPPAFLLSVLYPVLHGASPPAHLANLIAELSFRWELALERGDRFRASARQREVREGKRRDGSRFMCILSDTTYWNQRDEVVARAAANLLWVEPVGAPPVRAPHRYTDDEIETLLATLRERTRRGCRPFRAEELAPGTRLPPLLRPPLSIGDLVCWQAAAGPAHEVETGDPATALFRHPLTGWPVGRAAHHEDPTLAHLRGMPLPFDNGAMRFAWIAPLVTDWMGDHGVLEALSIRLTRPILYGDLARYEGVVERCHREGEGVRVALGLRGTNQLGETTTQGRAQVFLPTRALAAPRRSATDTGPRGAPSAGDRARAAARSGTVVDEFASHVERAPDAVALRQGDDCLRYGDLERLANRLAHRLRAEGVRAATRVAVFLERTPLAVAVSVAIAKLGATRISFDPAYAAGRLGALVEAVGATVLVVDDERDHGSLGMLPTAARTIYVPGPDLDAAVASSPPRGASGTDLAYIIFTSGSVGAPKAVAVDHLGLACAQRAIAAELGLGRGERFLHSASFAFSAAERQLWLPLTTGGCIVLAGDRERRDPLRLLATLRDGSVTVWDTVPSWLGLCIERLAALPDAEREALLPPRLRLLLLTGEALPWRLPLRWRRELGHDARIVNLYSQTETAGTTCAYPIEALPAEPRALVPIGHPLPGVRIDLLDAALTPVADGEVGEICIAAEQIADAYLDPEHTRSQHFLADPFAADGGRYYRSGDLGRRGADGNFEYVGRADDRLELRGFRVEPADVEEALLSHPGLREAFVRGDKDGARLIAYVVAAADGAAVPTASLSEAVRARLPPYMVPGAYVWLPSLPRTQSGKVDRAALPPPGDRRPDLGRPAIAPSDDLERALTEVWSEVLGLRAIGVDDDFFELGGDSVLAVAAIVASEHRLGRALALDWLYDAATVRAFAARARCPETVPAAPCVVPLLTGEGSSARFFIAGGGGHVFIFRQLARLLADADPAYGLQLPGLDPHSSPLSSIEEIAAELSRQVRLVRPVGPYHFIGYSFGGLVAYEMARQLGAVGARVGLVALIDTPAPGAFRRRPLLDRLRVHRQRLAERSAPARARYLYGLLQRRLERWRPTPAWGSVSVAAATATERRLSSVYETHRLAARAYRPAPYAGRVWLLRAAAPDWMRLNVVEPTYGWEALCTGGVSVRSVPGQHSEILGEPHVLELAAALRSALAEVPTAAPPSTRPSPRATPSWGYLSRK